MYFDELNLSDELLDALYYMGFENATPIQEQAIPAILEGRDLLACAQTGTGKTGAFLIPAIDKLIRLKNAGTGLLIIVPTRELAVQIEQQIQGITYDLGLSSIAIYGGGDGTGFAQQKEALTGGADIIVATPGKLISHLQLGYVKFNDLKFLVLDEADRMLDMGFLDDIKTIVKFLPAERQNLLFSATMPPGIRKLAQHLLNNAFEINLNLSKPAEGVDQKAYLVYPAQKNQLLIHLLSERKHYDSILLFTSAKSRVSEIVKALKTQGYAAMGISSNLDQNEREEVLNQFRSRKLRLLVATDLLSRGIDIKDINLVINYDVPHDAEDYIHRVGRTARASTKGEAITLISEEDMRKAARIEKLTGSEIPRYSLPEFLGSGPEWNPFYKNKNAGHKSSKGKHKPRHTPRKTQA